ncbi:hypothetical protein XENORESO_019832 [Xenotaenia resolanae]|uniref:Uncharacterized protein n=1 Tax=Xenotaenia resolanae TaxID=208358 RepID=A0ABV0WD69_9TELE
MTDPFCVAQLLSHSSPLTLIKAPQCFQPPLFCNHIIYQLNKLKHFIDLIKILMAQTSFYFFFFTASFRTNTKQMQALPFRLDEKRPSESQHPSVHQRQRHCNADRSRLIRTDDIPAGRIHPSNKREKNADIIE